MGDYEPKNGIVTVPMAYLAGPMRGVEAFNFPLFHAAAKWLKSIGWFVFDPARADEVEQGFPVNGHWPERGLLPVGISDWQHGNPLKGNDAEVAATKFDVTAAHRRDLAWITSEADRIVMLPGWEDSSGASFEKAVAEKCGLPVFILTPDPWTLTLHVEVES